jgi:hypothetical protein
MAKLPATTSSKYLGELTLIELSASSSRSLKRSSRSLRLPCHRGRCCFAYAAVVEEVEEKDSFDVVPESIG